MSSFLIQTEKAVRAAAGYVIFPALSVFLLFKAGISEYNFSGLLALPHYGHVISVLSVLLLVWILRCFYLLRERICMQHWRWQILLMAFAVCYAAAVFVHYEEGNALLSSLHLLDAYCAAVLFTIMMFMVMDRIWERYVYSAVLLLFFLLCISAGEISGPAELAYALGSVYLLCYCSFRS